MSIMTLLNMLKHNLVLKTFVHQSTFHEEF